ncbi:MAG: PilW family protein [Thiogranum sp.]
MTTIRKSDKRARRYMAGFSLVELMIAMLISLLLMAGVVQIFASTKNTFLSQEGNSRLQENSRFALGRLSEDISAAGYLGCLDSDAPLKPFVNVLTDQTLGSAYDFSTPIFGTDGTGANGSDTISIRRAGGGGGIPLTGPMNSPTSDIELDDTVVGYNSLQRFDLLVVGDCATAAVFMITNDPATSGGTIEHVAGVPAISGPNQGQSNSSQDLQTVFGADLASVAGAAQVGTVTYEICASTSGTGTSLYSNSNGCADITQTNELVEGVEDMQILYGIDNDATPGIEQYLRADQIPTATQWNNVSSVRLTLTFNTVQNVPGGSYSKQFTTTIRLRNRGV